MSAELFLIAPPEINAQRLIAALEAVLLSGEVSALLLQRGSLPENAYKTMVKAVLPMAQAAGVAVLIEGDPGLVRLLGADGLHVGGDANRLREALAALKPGLIVGVGDIHSRDEAMENGELGVDYILFGPLSGAIPAAERDLAHWWAETMEVPSVLSDPEATSADYDAEGCEFIGLPLQLLPEPAR